MCPKITSSKGKWTKATYKGKTGYVYTDYIIEGDKVQIETDREVNTAEDKVGMVEGYGFDQAGNKLFKVMLCDENEYFERKLLEAVNMETGMNLKVILL